MIQIGIDPSLNSTGVCVNKNGKCKYFIITSKMTKKMQLFDNQYITYLPFDKNDTNKKLNTYDEVEYNKAKNIYSICSIIKDIVKKNKPDIVVMEGISYGSVGSAALADLAGLNFAIRNTLIDADTPFVIVSPGQNKKFATGNGAADKELMIYNWLMIERHLKSITDIKIDDLADAYFLSCFTSENLI